MSPDPQRCVGRLLEAMDAYERALRVPLDRLALEIDGEACGLIGRAELGRTVVLPAHARSLSLRDERGTLRAFALFDETSASMSRCSSSPVKSTRSEKPMTQQESGSVVVSLAELMTLENERIESEEQARQQAEQARETARRERARLERDAERARQVEAERRRALERARAAEEQARLQAWQEATVEQARVDAERRARWHEQAAAREHEARLAVLQRDGQVRRLRSALVGALALVVTGGGVGGFLWHQDHLAAQLALATQTTEAEKLRTAHARSQRDHENAAASVEQLKADLKDAERELREERERADQAEERADRAQSRPRGAWQRPPRPTTQPPGRCRFKGDPLCGLNGSSEIP